MVKKVARPVILFFFVFLFNGIQQLCVCTESTLAWINGETQTPLKLEQTFSNLSNRTSCIEREREALVKLKRSFEDPSNRLVSWSGEDCCEWRGVSCDANTGHVLKLDLSPPSFSSFIPFLTLPTQRLLAVEVDSGLTELQHLEYLDLSGNDFNGIQIPGFFGSFKNLRYLNISGSGFGGKIPHQLGNLTKLAVLDLRNPGFYGFRGPHPLYTDNLVWLSSLSSLEHLDMSAANFSEALNLMHELNQLPSLLHLFLRGCGIQNIHFASTSLNFTFLSRIQTLDLASNRFVGPIPNALNNMTSLRSLDISNNEFGSTVPLLLVNSKTLVNLDVAWNEFERVEGGSFSILNKACSSKSLDLSYNRFGAEILVSNASLSRCANGYDLEFLSLEYNQIVGKIPDWFGKLENLKYLNLGSNSLSGSIPFSLGKLSKLRGLKLSRNQLSDSIPYSLESLLALEYLDLSQNQLTSSIPRSLGNRLALRYLDLSYNLLNGTIPQPFGSMLVLWNLDLSQNQLSGPIPQSFESLLALRYLDLSQNQLIGNIQQSMDGLFSLTDLILANNQLSGHVPEKIGQFVNLRRLDISYNSFSGVFSEHHLANASSLTSISINSNHLSCNFRSDWIPPFSLWFVNMSSCVFGSLFPHWIQTQKGIGFLDLSNSSISGDLPTWPLPTSLFYLDLSKNKISGNPLAEIALYLPRIVTLLLGNNMISSSLPDSLCKLGYLEILDLSENGLSGEIPGCWKEMQSLIVINLSSNKLSGSIPSTSLQLSTLKRFHVNKNNFRGELPQALRDCPNLELLDLGDNNFSGAIPTWIGNSSSSLRILRLRKNMLDGRIPHQICDLHHLQFLDLAQNNLIGEIPHCFSNLSGMSTALSLDPVRRDVYAPAPPRYDDPSWSRERLPVVTKGSDLEFTKLQLQLLDIMDLSSNKLTGVIPAELCKLSGLRGLNLSNNELSGKIPSQIGALKSLETLDLSNNRLFGTIPRNLTALQFISHLNLSHNDLSGRIPEGNQLRTLTDPSIYGGNSKLCGDPLPKKCVQPPISSGHEKAGNGDDTKKEKILFWFVVTTGYALGLWGVIGILVFKKNWRIAYFRFVEDKNERILAMIAIKVARLKRRMQRT